DAARLNLPLPPMAVIPNGIDPEPWDGGEAAVPSPFLLFLGRLSWKKGLDRLIPALARVPGITLALAGNDEEGITPDLQRLAQEHGVADRTVFLGPVHGPEKAALLHQASVLVLPSTSENFGNVVLEAWAAGRPAVVTPGVGLAQAVRETGAGIVAEGDPVSLGDALRALLADPDRLDEMGRRGADAVRERFGWAAVGRDMEELYLRVTV
ncbi:MAG TPA: glycosyltransferase, partial [Thermoanaerobaculia bacterium]|nr:glycosyltransferase [Thermoanaerobaculia bacterium]